MEGKGRMVLMWLFFQDDKKVGAETEEFMRAVRCGRIKGKQSFNMDVDM